MIEKIGIDLGAFNTSIAFTADDRIAQIDFKEGSNLIDGPYICPSYVSYNENGNVLEHGGPAKANVLPRVPQLLEIVK